MKRAVFLFFNALFILFASSNAVAQTMREWQEPEVNAVNRLPMHSAYNINTRGLENRVTLNGRWKFRFVKDADSRPKDFFGTDFDDKSWDNIEVPALWQLSGYGDPLYVNIGYPWRNQFRSEPPKVPVKDNYVGSYRRTLSVPSTWRGKDIILHLGSVTSCVYVWVNGKFLGYSEDSKLEPEFNATRLIIPGRENVIALQVFRFSDGTYLEDQDFFRYSGIARDCYLQARSKKRIEDIEVTPDLDSQYKNGTLSVRLKTTAKAPVLLTLKDASGKTVQSLTTANDKALISVENPLKWTAETPHLYTLTAQMQGTDEEISLKTGFRKIELLNAQVLVNGKPVLFKGADRHELDPDGGYVLSKERMEQDIRIMKELNINAVRTSHYPDDTYWYDLCDKYGLYMVAEANLESHGMGYGDKTLAKRKDFRKAHLERNERNVLRNFNHPSVIFWSLGNEAGYGANFEAAYDLVKAMDPSRLVQYERAEEQGKTDIFCPMYYGYEDCEAYCQNKSKTKPLIQCEYAHAMGNSEGGFKEYWDLVRKYPKYQGGFIWDFVDQSPHKTGLNGKTVYGYGGDWNRYDASDGNFCDNGLISPDRRYNPHAYEVQRIYQNVHTRLLSYANGQADLEIYNEHFFQDLSPYAMHWTLLLDGVPQKTGVVSDLSAKPQQTARISLPLKTKETGEELLNVEYRLKEAQGPLPAGYRVARDQLTLQSRNVNQPAAECQSIAAELSIAQNGPLTIEDGDNNWLVVKNNAVTIEISKHTGYIVKYLLWGSDMISPEMPLRPNFWRAPTDNDYGAYLQQRYALWREPTMKLTSLKHSTKCGNATVEAALDIPEAEATLLLSYEISPSGSVSVTQRMETHGKEKSEMFRFGMQMQMPEGFENITYYGRGPHENYADRKQSADLGIYRQTVTEQFYPYIRPQECGLKTDIRWWQILGKGNVGLKITASKPFSASALHYTIASLDGGKEKTNLHSPEIEPISGTTLCIDAVHCGLGCVNSWGAVARDHYRVPYKDYVLRFTLSPVRL